MKYINIFNTSGDVQTALNNETLLKPYLAYISGSNIYDFNTLSPSSGSPVQDERLYITFLESGTFNMSRVRDDVYLLYGPSETHFYGITVGENGASIDVNAGDKLYFGTNSPYQATALRFWNNTIRFSVGGNIMSLGNWSDYQTLTTPIEFDSLFMNCIGLVDASNLILPLNGNTYVQMFSGCYSLTTSPALPVGRIPSWGYGNMFNGCSSLNYIKCLATDISADWCTYNWIEGVSQTGTFVKTSGVDWSVKTGNDGIPSGWTVIEE